MEFQNLERFGSDMVCGDCQNGDHMPGGNDPGCVAQQFRLYTLAADVPLGGTDRVADFGSEHLKLLDHIQP